MVFYEKIGDGTTEIRKEMPGFPLKIQQLQRSFMYGTQAAMRVHKLSLLHERRHVQCTFRRLRCAQQRELSAHYRVCNGKQHPAHQHACAN